MNKLSVRLAAGLVGAVLVGGVFPVSSAVAATKDECTAKRVSSTPVQISSGGQWSTMDPINAIGSVAPVRAGMNSFAVYDTMALRTPDGKVLFRGPSQSLKGNADSTEWVLKVKPGITFGNGDPVDAAAIVASTIRVADASLGGTGRATYNERIASITATDPSTVTFKLKQPWAEFAEFLAGDSGKVLNTNLIKKEGQNNFALGKIKGVGIGAYEIDTWIPNESLTVTAKPNWWGGKLCIQTLKFVALGTDDLQLQAVINGQIGGGFIADPNVIVQAQQKGIKTVPAPTFGSPALFINMRAGNPGADLRVRQAINLGMDVKQIASHVYPTIKDKDLVNPTKFYVPTSDADHTKDMKEPPTNAAQAKKLLDTVKAEGKYDGKIELLSANVPPTNLVAQALQAQLNAVGFNVTLNLTDNNTLNTLTNVSHNYQMALAIIGGSPGSLSFSLFTSSNASNRPGYANPTFDDLSAKLAAQPTRAEYLKSLTQLVNFQAADLPVIPLMAVSRAAVIAKNMHGVYAGRGGLLVFDKAYVAKS